MRPNSAPHLTRLSLRIKTEGVDNETEADADNITGALPRFNPGVEFKKALKALEFRKA